MKEEKLHTLLYNLQSFSMKVQTFHWNIEGEGFIEHHKFLGKLYSSVNDTIDGVAECIRQKDSLVSFKIDQIKENSIVEETSLEKFKSLEIFTELHSDNFKLLSLLYDCYEEAESEASLGVSNFIQGKIEEHEKLGWFLKSISSHE